VDRHVVRQAVDDIVAQVVVGVERDAAFRGELG